MAKHEVRALEIVEDMTLNPLYAGEPERDACRIAIRIAIAQALRQAEADALERAAMVADSFKKDYDRISTTENFEWVESLAETAGNIADDIRALKADTNEAATG